MSSTAAPKTGVGWLAAGVAGAVRRGAGRVDPRQRRKADPDTAAADDRLSLALGTQVAIRRARRGGEIRVRFASEEELIRLFQVLAGEER